MIVRLMEDKDKEIVKSIHNTYHAEDYDYSDLLNSISHIVVTDDDGNIITCGALKPLVEIVAATDMKLSVKVRMEALIRLMQALEFMASKANFDSIHCFPLTDDDWIEHLKKYGFHPTKGICLSKGVA